MEYVIRNTGRNQDRFIADLLLVSGLQWRLLSVVSGLYRQPLSNIPGLSLPPTLNIVACNPHTQHVVFPESRRPDARAVKHLWGHVCAVLWACATGRSPRSVPTQLAAEANGHNDSCLGRNRKTALCQRIDEEIQLRAQRPTAGTAAGVQGGAGDAAGDATAVQF